MHQTYDTFNWVKDKIKEISGIILTEQQLSKILQLYPQDYLWIGMWGGGK
jgi:hypothetical protein